MSDSRLRVVMLCRDDPSSRIVFHAIAKDSDVVKVVMEDRPPVAAFFRNRIRKLGPSRVIGQMLFLVVNRALRPLSAARVREIESMHGMDSSPIPGESVRRVASVNSPEVADILRGARADAVIVNGTRILGAETLAAAQVPYLNTHMGITPRYRGVHGGYWALANADRPHCGVTIHLVDTGIDTGGVLYQDRIEPTARDSFDTYPSLQLAKALPLIRTALEDVRLGRLAPRSPEGPSRLWSHPTLLQYLSNRFRGVR